VYTVTEGDEQHEAGADGSQSKSRATATKVSIGSVCVYDIIIYRLSETHPGGDITVNTSVANRLD
jgi:hypothetical protein